MLANARVWFSKEAPREWGLSFFLQPDGEAEREFKPPPCNPQEGARCTHRDLLFLLGLARRCVALASGRSVAAPPPASNPLMGRESVKGAACADI